MDSYIAVVDYLAAQFQSGNYTQFVCQNGRQWLFGTQSVQWNANHALDFLNKLSRLWENWE